MEKMISRFVLCCWMVAPAMLLAQAPAPLPRVIVRDDGMWVEPGDRRPVRVSENNFCNSVQQVEWIESGRLAVECHINPSLEEYFEVDVVGGRTTKDLLGYWFERSPDRQKVAHVGWIPHFAPAYAKSNSLQIDGKTVYPAGDGASRDASLAERRGAVYVGIHDFHSGLSWSPDGTRVALLERVFDWQPDGPDSNAGTELNGREFLVVAGEAGAAMRMEIAKPAGEAQIVWTSGDTLVYSWAGVQRTVRIDQGRLTQ